MRLETRLVSVYLQQRVAAFMGRFFRSPRDDLVNFRFQSRRRTFHA